MNDSFQEGRSLADDLELLAHLKECPACARQAQAARELQQAFSALAVENSADAITWSEQIRRVETQAALDTNRKENPMSALRDVLRRRPRLGYGLAAALALILAAALIPLKVDRTVGFEVAVAGVNRDLAFDRERIDDLLERLGVNGATVDVTGCEETCNLKIASLKSPEDAAIIKIAFEELSESAGMKQIVIELNSVNCQVSTSALGHVTKTFIAGTSDNPNELLQIRELVAHKLDGFDGAVFFYCDTLSQDGKQIQLTTNVGGSDNPQWVSVSAAGQVDLDAEEVSWTGVNADSFSVHMITLHDGDRAFGGCVVHPSQIVDGRLTPEARAALEAKGYVVEDVTNPDGSTSIKLVKNVDGKDQVIEVQVKSCVDSVMVDEAAKDAVAETLPEGYSLSQNYPNPFNPTTDIQFSLPSAQHVTLEIYNINGQKVRTLVDETMGPGSHSVEWNATDESGNQVATGVYLYRFTAGDVTQTKKMSFVK